MKYAVLLILTIMTSSLALAYNCKDLETYYRFNKSQCDDASSELKKLRDAQLSAPSRKEIDDKLLSIRAQENIVQKNHHEIYEGRKAYLKNIEQGQISLSDARAALSGDASSHACTAITNRAITSLVDKAKPPLSFFDKSVLDIIKTVSIDCRETIFKLIDANNFEKNKKAVQDKHTQELIKLHNQATGRNP